MKKKKKKKATWHGDGLAVKGDKVLAVATVEFGGGRQRKKKKKKKICSGEREERK
jgi:hypothetical protein